MITYFMVRRNNIIWDTSPSLQRGLSMAATWGRPYVQGMHSVPYATSIELVGTAYPTLLRRCRRLQSEKFQPH